MTTTSPAWLLVARNLRIGERSWGQPLLRFAMAGAALLALAFTYNTRVAFGGPGARLLSGLVWADTWGLIIAGVSLFPSLIAEEREQQSLPLLRLAGFGAAGFLLGQSFSAFAYCVLALAVQVPFLMLAITLGGTSTGAVLTTLLVLGVGAILVYAAALLAGAWARTARGASRLAALLVMSVTLLPGAMGGIETRTLGSHHLARFAQILMPNLLEQAAMPVRDWAWMGKSLASQLALAAGLAMVAFLVFSRRQEHVGERRAVRTGTERGRYPTGRAAFAALADRGPGRWGRWRFIALGHLLLAGLVLLSQGRSGAFGIVSIQIVVAGVNLGQLASRATHAVRRERIAGLLLLAGGPHVWQQQQRLVRIRVFAVHILAVLISFAVISGAIGVWLSGEILIMLLSTTLGIAFLADRLGEFCGLAFKRAPTAATLLAGLVLVALVSLLGAWLAAGGGDAAAFILATLIIYLTLGLALSGATRARLVKVYAE